MIEINKIYNKDCIEFMNDMSEENLKVDLILTSPPYNTSRTTGSIKNAEIRYDVYRENRENTDYDEWTLNIFNGFDNILKNNGCVLYNISYGNENPTQMFTCINKIITCSNFTIADIIGWKKHSALPNNVSQNKLTRIFEFIFVLCRKSEYHTFHCNKKIVSKRNNMQNMYENIFNLIVAKNNDGSNNLNKATFSTELVRKLLNIYGNRNGIVYDPFMGTGTTAVACKICNISYLGTEISKKQCEYANSRLSNTTSSLF